MALDHAGSTPAVHPKFGGDNMAIATGKAARRRYGTKAAAKRDRKRTGKQFDTPQQEKEAYRALKRKKKDALKKRGL